MQWREFIKVLKKHKEDYFHKNDVPKQLMGPIHGLALQLLAKGIIELQVSDHTKVGTKELNDKHILVALSIDFYHMDKWESMSVIG